MNRRSTNGRCPLPQRRIACSKCRPRAQPRECTHDHAQRTRSDFLAYLREPVKELGFPSLVNTDARIPHLAPEPAHTGGLQCITSGELVLEACVQLSNAPQDFPHGYRILA